MSSFALFELISSLTMSEKRYFKLFSSRHVIGDSNDYIKNVYVDIDIDLSLPQFSELNAIGNSVFIEGGNKGIIIYHYAL